MFTCLRGTSFEHGIDAAIRRHDKRVLLFKAFKSDKKDEAYIFKNEYSACIKIETIKEGKHLIKGGHLKGRICRIKDEWSNLTGLLNCGS
ncbi:hypothetical protein P8452_55877 [Trifolium repens]|nr:hypothetical protein P8452_55877 [Trifolium repens]